MRNGRFLPNRTRGAVRKARNRSARKAERERQALIPAEDWLQPPITPESFQHYAANDQLPATATSSLGRQASAQNYQYELAKRVADLVDLAEHMNGKLGEVKAVMEENTRRVAQLKEHAKLPGSIDLMNQHEEPTHFVPDIPAALTLSLIANPVLSTLVNPPPNADQDLFIGSDILQLNNEVASSAHEADREIRRGLNDQSSIAFADGIGEGPSDDEVLRGVSGRQVEAVTESLGIEENDGEEFDYEQFLSYASIE